MEEESNVIYKDSEGNAKEMTNGKFGEETKRSEKLLEEVIMSWTKKRQQDYLKLKNLAIHGTKVQLMLRILSNIPIQEALEFMREYRRNVVEERNTGNREEGGKDNEILEVDMERMEMVLKRKREEKGENSPNKINVQEDIRITTSPVQENNETESLEINASLINLENNKTKELQKKNEVNKERNVARKVNDNNEKGSNGEEEDSIETTKAENIKRTRIGLMITLSPSNEPDKNLSLQLQKWFSKMKDIDNKFTVISWKTSEGPIDPIKLTKNIPKTMSKLRIYFARVQSRSSGGKIYADVFVQHSIPMDDLKADSEWFLKENQMAIYKKKLQVEATAQKGWLLYSTQSMDKDVLEEAIEAKIGTKVALRWKFVNSSKYTDNEEEKKKWKALHIEVDARDEKKASRELNKIYGSQSKIFPLGIRMRLVPEFKEVRGNSWMTEKHTRLRTRQASFSSLIEGYYSDDIQMLDYEDEGLTLREMLMTIQSKNPETPGNLFHAIGRDWKGRVIFNFLKNKADEAKMIIDGIIPYLQHEYGEQVNLFFDPEAVIEKEKWEWNEKKGILITPLSKELEGLEALDDDYNFSTQMLGKEQQENREETMNDNNKLKTDTRKRNKSAAEELALARLNLVVTGEDNDSVSTLGNPMTPASVQKAKISNMIPLRTARSNASSITESSINSRMTAIEQRIESMEESITQSLEKTMEKIIDRMSANNSSLLLNQPPGGELAGRSHE